MNDEYVFQKTALILLENSTKLTQTVCCINLEVKNKKSISNQLE